MDKKEIKYVKQNGRKEEDTRKKRKDGRKKTMK
jgi:hypothetical protein